MAVTLLTIGITATSWPDGAAAGPRAVATAAPDPSAAPAAHVPLAPAAPPTAIPGLELIHKGSAVRRWVHGLHLRLCPAPPDPTTLRVLTFNIHSGRDGTRYALGRIAAEISAWSPDIVLLQEVDRFRAWTGFSDEPGLLASALGMTYVFADNVPRSPAGRGQPPAAYGTAILTRFPVVRTANTLLPNRGGLQQRGLLHAVLKIGTQQLSVYDTHLENKSESMRSAQARFIAPLVGADSLPVLLGGDLNDPPSSGAIEPIRATLSDAWAAAGVGPAATVPAWRPRMRIDYLMYGGSQLTPTSVQVMPTSVSDHRAVLGEFELAAPRTCGLP